MADVTYYIALLFVAGDHGVAAGEPTECFNPNAVQMRAEALSRKEAHPVGPLHLAARATLLPAISALQRSPGNSTICLTI